MADDMVADTQKIIDSASKAAGAAPTAVGAAGQSDASVQQTDDTPPAETSVSEAIKESPEEPPIKPDQETEPVETSGQQDPVPSAPPPEPPPEPMGGTTPDQEPPKEIPEIKDIAQAAAIIPPADASSQQSGIIVPPAAGQPPKPDAVKSESPKPKKGKGLKTGVLLTVLLLAVTLPLGILFVSNNQEMIADLRSKAATPYPTGSTCGGTTGRCDGCDELCYGKKIWDVCNTNTGDRCVDDVSTSSVWGWAVCKCGDRSPTNPPQGNCGIYNCDYDKSCCCTIGCVLFPAGQTRDTVVCEDVCQGGGGTPPPASSDTCQGNTTKETCNAACGIHDGLSTNCGKWIAEENKCNSIGSFCTKPCSSLKTKALCDISCNGGKDGNQCKWDDTDSICEEDPKIKCENSTAAFPCSLESEASCVNKFENQQCGATAENKCDIDYAGGLQYDGKYRCDCYNASVPTATPNVNSGCNQGVTSGCGAAPPASQIPQYATSAQIGPFNEDGILVIYYQSYEIDTTDETVATINLTHNGTTYQQDVQGLANGRKRVVTDIQFAPGDIINLISVKEQAQTDACAPNNTQPNYGLGWIPPQNNTCGTGLPTSPNGGVCVPYAKPDISSVVDWAADYGQPLNSVQCWADWMEWPGDYDFNDYVLIFSYEPVVIPRCINIAIYKDDVQINPDETALAIGDEIILAVKGNQTAEKARFRINGIEPPLETTDVNEHEEFVLPFTIENAGQYTIDAEVFIGGQWY